MAANRKLTRVIKGRKVQTIAQPVADRGKTYLVQFEDGSKMRVKIAPDSCPQAPDDFSSPIESVRQDEATMSMDLENGKAIEFSLLEATSSVLLRDKNGGFEYAD